MKKLEEPTLPFEADKFSWLGSMHKFNFMLTVKADSPWKTYEEFVDFARKNPEKLIIGSDGAGGSQHIAQAQFGEMAGFKFKHLPFAGGGPAVQALLGGHVNAVTTSPGPTAAYLKSGDLRYVVNFSDKRNQEYPDVPTIKEKGMSLFLASFYSADIERLWIEENQSVAKAQPYRYTHTIWTCHRARSNQSTGREVYADDSGWHFHRLGLDRYRWEDPAQ